MPASAFAAVHLSLTAIVGTKSAGFDVVPLAVTFIVLAFVHLSALLRI
jgi:hypothetical protein